MEMEPKKDLQAVVSVDAKKTPKRIAFIKGRTAPRVRDEEEDMVMTVPHLVARELIAFEVLVIALVMVSLLFNAPLEWIADPQHTPNPAKAPWYFLGLQELLHYFPPVVAGVILPTLAVIALIIIPYVQINVKREGLWKEDQRRTLVILLVVAGILSVVLLLFSVYAMLIPTLLIVGAMLSPYFFPRTHGFVAWLSDRPLAWWVMTWFVTIVIVLTTIGTLFRGPEWSWTWPWNGIY
jgi:menaquinol-cytochrome c reductase cytochrome b/c subunit